MDRRPAPQSDDPSIDQCKTEGQAHEQKAGAGPAVRECGEQASQNGSCPDVSRLGNYECERKPQSGDQGTLLSEPRLSELGFDDAALHANRGGMGSVVSAQFGEDVLDSALDGFFGDRELIRNLFIRIPRRNQAQHTDFTGS